MTVHFWDGGYRVGHGATSPCDPPLDPTSLLSSDWAHVNCPDCLAQRPDAAACVTCGRDLTDRPLVSNTDDAGETWDGPHCYPPCDDLAKERADVLARFTAELSKATGDGSKKRRAGTKPPWYEDDAHEGAIFSHLTKWKRGETVDPDSGAHPLVHLAWRALAIACRESGNVPS